MTVCPGPETLRRFLARELDAEERRQLLAHAETCAVCRDGLRGAPDTIDLSGPFSSSLPPPDDTDGHAPLPVLADYEILRMLGRGGMGVVYLARDSALNRLVAIKMLLGGAQASPQEQARFRAEAEAVARIQHPHVVQIYTSGRHEGCPYLVCEYVEGGSLAARLERRPQPPRDAARFVELVARGVHAAHQRGIVHRDLKPANVLLAPPAEEPALNSAYGVPKVADFGLARSTEESLRQGASGLVGTADYMAPEQARGLPAGRAADVYALGIILYECLTGRPPFVGTTMWELLVQVREAEPVPPRRLVVGLPRDVETICLKCLEKDPRRRYASAAYLAEDLHRYLHHFAISARRVGPFGRTVKWVRRRPTLAAAVACSSLAVLVAGGFGYQAHRTEQRRQIEQDLASADLQKDRQERALETALAAAMSGDLEKAEKAIRAAEHQGATNALIHMLRGQVAFYRGDPERALADLEQAVKLDPDSVAARALLANTYSHFGRMDQYGRMKDELLALTPHTAEDFLFRGYAHRWSPTNYALASRDLNEAVKLSHLPFARVIRAAARSLWAEDRSDVEEAEGALADVRAAKDYLADNAYVLAVSVQAQLVAANLYREAGKPEKQRAALEQAQRDAQALKPWDTLLFPFEALWLYFEQTGDESACFDLARRASEKSAAPVVVYHYAQALYRRGQIAETLRVLDRAKWPSFPVEYLRICALAEQHPQDLRLARGALAEMESRNPLGVPLAWNDKQRFLRLLGCKSEAVAASRTLRQQDQNLAPFQRLTLDYYCEDTSENTYLEESFKPGDLSRWGRLGLHYDIAVTRLANADRPGARKHFREAVRTGVLLPYNVDFSRSFLTRMERDPTWPPWIPVKSDEPRRSAGSSP